MLNIGVGILIAFVVFGKRTRQLGKKLKAVTFPDLMGKRFKSSFMQYAAAIIILIAMPLYAAAVLIGGSRFVETTLGVDFTLALLAFAVITAIYVIFGGLIAVMYTDAMQGIIMIVGMVALSDTHLHAAGRPHDCLHQSIQPRRQRYRPPWPARE